MSFPNIPNVTPTISLSREEVVNLLLASIAFEELGLAHIINAEGEKIQAVVGTLPGVSIPNVDLAALLALNENVNKMLKTVTKSEMLLQFKLEELISTSTTTTAVPTTTTTTTTEVPTTTTTTTTEAPTTTTTTTTTTSTTSTTTTTTTTLTIQNVASVSSQFNGVTYSDTDNAFYTTSNPPATGFTTSQTQSGGNTNIILGGVNLGNLPRYLLFFADGHIDANWQGATKGFVGNVAVDGLQASERTSGGVPYAGTITTNAPTLEAWQAIVDQNPGQAFEITGATNVIADLESNLVSAFHQINALPATPGFESIDSSALNGLNTQNGINETFVINITSGFSISNQLFVTGDPGDVYILRWDEGTFDPTDGYQGQVKFQSGGAIVPQGGLTPSNFISVAGNIGSSGGGTTPPPPYPQGPRFDNGQGALIAGGQDFSGGGFFTGYWLTTGAPTTFDPTTGLWVGETQSLSNGIFVGGWYTLTTAFSMTSGTSGVYVSPNPSTQQAAIDLVKLVSVDNGATYQESRTSPGPALQDAFPPKYRFVITNTGTVPLDNVTFFDSQLNQTITLGTINPQQVIVIDATGF